MTKEDIIKYADRLFINLNEKEINELITEFKELEESSNELSNISSKTDLEPLYYCIEDIKSEFRKDTIEESISVSDAFKNSSKHTEDEIEIVKVVQ